MLTTKAGHLPLRPQPRILFNELLEHGLHHHRIHVLRRAVVRLLERPFDHLITTSR